MLFSDIPTIGLGPKGGGLTQTGKHDEWVDVDESIMTIKVLAGMIMDWCEV
jgi:acetylornithine deacetylase